MFRAGPCNVASNPVTEWGSAFRAAKSLSCTGLYHGPSPKDLDRKAGGRDVAFPLSFQKGFGWVLATNAALLDGLDTALSSSPIAALML